MWLILIQVGLVLFAILTKSEAVVELSENLQKRLAEFESATIFITISKSPLSICSSADNGNSPVGLIQKLKAHASVTQEPILDILHLHGVRNYHSYWISNRIYVPACTAFLISILQLHEAVSEIKEELHFPLEPIRHAPTLQRRISWGVAEVNAPEVWLTGNTGQGVIVGHIDTGVRGTHRDLKENYLGLWYDPGRNTTEPNDQLGHGTHSLGTIVGSNGIGVAPGAKWLSCKGCGVDNCSEAHLLACGQWIMCPDGVESGCKLKPHVASNSWGDDGVNSFYDSTITCWLAMDIIPVFANGNSGPKCGSSVNPGSSPNVISVGAVDMSRKLADFSSRALSSTPDPNFPLDRYKPDVSAPGVEIRSAWHTGDNDYVTISGTSMATPHVTGVIALMLSAMLSCSNERADFNVTKRHLLEGCSTLGLRRPDVICEEVNLGLDHLFPLKFPNNEYGHGLVDALESVWRVKKLTSCDEIQMGHRTGKSYVPATSAHQNGLRGSQGKNVWYPKSWDEVERVLAGRSP